MSYGVYGDANASGTNYGVYGTASGGTTNWAGYFSGDVNVTADLAVDTSTLVVDATNNRVGIGTSGPAYPLDVRTSTADRAVYGQATESSSGSAYGLYGSAIANALTGAVTAYGVRGDANANTTLGGPSASARGGYFSANAYHSAYGVYGSASSDTSTAYGVYGTTTAGATRWAGYFSGNVNVTGTLSKGGGAFKIDHPLDPENKYLYHSFVESPDMMNVYNGNVVLGAAGTAEVTMPEWFEALNRDFRYQLTPIGGPGPNLYIAKEIEGNKFTIAGGGAGLKVSWQVTGVRHDMWADANRIPVEENKKTEEKGLYLHPEAFGLEEAKGIDYQTRAKAEEPPEPEPPSATDGASSQSNGQTSEQPSDERAPRENGGVR